MPLRRRGVGRVGRPGLVGTVARTAVVAGTATAVVGGVSRHQAGKAQQQQDAAAYQQEQAAPPQEVVYAAPPPPPPAPAQDTTLDQLKQLGDLHSSGVLTDDEFAAQKAKILGG
jgi:Short C-terminal domain